MENQLRKELIALLQGCKLSRDEILSVSVAVAREADTKAMIAYLKEMENPSADQIFQKAGEIAFGKNS